MLMMIEKEHAQERRYRGGMRDSLAEILPLLVLRQRLGTCTLAVWKREMGSCVGMAIFPGTLSIPPSHQDFWHLAFRGPGLT